jgi:hypothetical protein
VGRPRRRRQGDRPPGRIARALRTVVRASAARDERRPCRDHGVRRRLRCRRR